jgi:broad specificity phosphatase PhoE
MARIYLIRHGKPASTWGDADEDPGLDDLGRAQADRARDWLLARPQDERPRLVVSSPLRRCRETAEPMAQALGLTAEVDPRVGEIPTPKALSAADRPGWLRAAFEGTWKSIPGDLDYDLWRGEIAASLVSRGDTAVFSHYVAINAVVSRLLGLDEVLAFRPDHCSITVLETDGRTLSLVAQGAEASTGVL